MLGAEGYSTVWKGKSVFPKHTVTELGPWVDELVRNKAIMHLTMLVTQAVLFICPVHGSGGKCDHVTHLRAATKQLKKVKVGMKVEVLWNPRGWGVGKVCVERGESWMLKLEGRTDGKAGR